MSKTTAPTRFSLRRRPMAGALVSLLAWLALLIAPVAAQAMTRIDPGVPGAIICSVNKVPGTESGKSVAPHCQLCTLAQQALDTPPLAEAALRVRLLGVLSPPTPAEDPSSDIHPEHPPRAPPLA